MTPFTRAAVRLRSRLNASPEWRAWQTACREARRVPRRTPGRIRLAGYDVGYVDLLTLCPQWHDLFVKKTLDIRFGRPDPVILDCGANIGLATLFLKSSYPGARIRAFEADDAIAHVLEENLRRNGAADVQVSRAAVWVHTGRVAFRAEGADSGAIDAVASRALQGATRDVSCLRLRDLLQEPRVDLLKLDVEGAEADLLDDAGDLLRRVGALAVEVHEFDPSVRRLPRVLSRLSAAGFTWSMDEVVAAPWTTAGAQPPFTHASLSFAVLVRAWREAVAP